MITVMETMITIIITMTTMILLYDDNDDDDDNDDSDDNDDNDDNEDNDDDDDNDADDDDDDNHDKIQSNSRAHFCWFLTNVPHSCIDTDTDIETARDTDRDVHIFLCLFLYSVRIPSSCTDTDTDTDTATDTDREVPDADVATDTNIESVRTCRRTGLNSVTLSARRSRLRIRTDTCIRMWCRFFIFLEIEKHTLIQRQLQTETYMM